MPVNIFQQSSFSSPIVKPSLPRGRPVEVFALIIINRQA
jgi:hypothetical protein